MPIPGTGAVPTGAIYEELTAVTRRAFIPRVVVQLYYSSPLMMLLLANAQRSAGGLSQITGPVQGASMVQGAWTGYSGTFNKPSIITGLQNYQFNTSYYTVPVPLVMGEALIQSTEALIPIIDVRMNDVYAVTNQTMASALFTLNTANPLMPSSLVDAVDNGTNAPTYGGIDRTAAGNSYWQAQVYDANSANILTRSAIASYLIQITDVAGGEAPDFVVMSPGDYASLNAQFIGTEQIHTRPGEEYSIDTKIRSSFPNLNINGIPIFMDHWCPTGTMYALNSKYLSLYLSEDAPFIFSGFYSTVPLLQIAQIGVMLVGYNVICTKPVSCAQITNFTGAAF
jgi:hypothetical protein